MPAQPLTSQQIEEAAQLKSLFKQWQARHREQGVSVSQEQAAESLGFGQSAFSQYLNGKIPLNVDAAIKFANLLGCKVSDFSETLAEQAARYSQAAPESVRLSSLPARIRPDEVEIKQYRNTGGSMGNGVLLRDQPGEIQSWRVTQEWIAKNVKSHSGVLNLAIVTGFGDSMKPMYNPGDPLIVDTGVKSVDFDGVYFFRVGEEGFIKRLQRIPGEGLVAISENKAYRDWTIKPDMDFEVFGRILKVWCSTDF